MFDVDTFVLTRIKEKDKEKKTMFSLRYVPGSHYVSVTPSSSLHLFPVLLRRLATRDIDCQTEGRKKSAK